MLKSNLGQTLIRPNQGRFAIHSMIDRAKGYILSDCHREKLVVRVLKQKPYPASDLRSRFGRNLQAFHPNSSLVRDYNRLVSPLP